MHRQRAGYMGQPASTLLQDCCRGIFIIHDINAGLGPGEGTLSAPCSPGGENRKHPGTCYKHRTEQSCKFCGIQPGWQKPGFRVRGWYCAVMGY